MIKSLDKKNGGYTLMELLVSIGMIAVISATAVMSVNIRGGDQAVLRAAQSFAFDIRKVQNLALSPKKYGANSVCFYGVKIKTAQQYFIYYDDQAGCSGPNKYTGSSVKISTVNLDSGVQFDGSVVNLDLAFKPPEPIVYLTSGGTSSGFAEKSIPMKIGNYTRYIKVNKFGNVTVQ